MSNVDKAGTFLLDNHRVNRMGYGAMQLAGPGVFGPVKDPEAAAAVLREAVAQGVNHIDTADFYGPHVTNRLIREALHPYADDLLIVTKVGAVRGAEASWNPALSPAELTRAVYDNLKNLGLDALDVVNFRAWGDQQSPAEGSIEEPFGALVRLQEQGLIRHLGLSNVTATQIRQAQGMAEIVCVQNHYNLSHRDDEALIAELQEQGIAYVPFFPIGGFSPLQSETLSSMARRMDASPLCVALAWLLQRSPNILLIPGTSSVAHLRENLSASVLVIEPELLAELDSVASRKD
ncbi:aldo/keto reductase family oxidoreductase [Pseudomonas cannabina]|uniref:Oxidoreductase n=1 Tax=Pseudomonas syringae pv. maculicola str. ES4326 TaxID=629265 RepID=A0A8T8C1V0_PSEYM|nr:MULTISPECIES: aldo/keto reductase family oxidoreductase [Pseudomonas syringae group]QHE97521.1 oxidoreductase [Pseudomonas syringae pv. maculicola str. ES4326]QQN24225.1 aldo/keto reductase family oxidoreductase [Pseudomonas cannabina pv. alisalensis]UBY98197.1 aldo/keto reductase family oxidoreductase [Pseudomonas cannabina pv. alisalensis]